LWYFINWDSVVSVIPTRVEFEISCLTSPVNSLFLKGQKAFNNSDNFIGEIVFHWEPLVSLCDISAVIPDHGLRIGPESWVRATYATWMPKIRGSSQVSGSSRNSGMQIEISHCWHTAPCSPLHTCVRACVHACVRACVCISRVYMHT